MKSLILTIVSIIAVPLLTACAAPSIKPCGASPLNLLGNTASARAFDPFEYHRHLKSLNRAELSKEREQASRELQDSDRASTRVRLALALSVPNSSGQNLSHAYSLLEEASRMNLADCDPAFTEYLANQIRVREKESNWAQSLLIENKMMRERLSTYKDKLGTYKEEAQTKTQQLEQLKQVDEKIHQRDDPTLPILKNSE